MRFRFFGYRLGLVAAAMAGASACFNPSFPNSCFLPGTLIQTPHGEIPIEDLQLGQQVSSYDTETQQVVEGVVEELIDRDVESYLELELSNQRTLRVTQDHPMAVWKDGAVTWVEAGALDLTSEVVALGEEETVETATILTIRSVQVPTKVHNLKVRRYQNSFAEGLLTHFYFPNLGAMTQDQR